MSYDDDVSSHKVQYRGQLYKYTIPKGSTLDLICEAVIEGAAQARSNAGYSGAHHDGGGQAAVNNLKAFLDGVKFQATGELDGAYKKIVDEIKKKSDPDYQAYLALKARFGE